jgi:hypothetical protein
MDETIIIEEVKTPHEYYRLFLLFGARYSVFLNEDNILGVTLKDHLSVLYLKKDIAYPILDSWQEKPLVNFQTLFDVLTENNALITNE